MRAACTLLALLLLSQPAHAARQDWTFLPIQDIGARSFLEQHPDYDGRGVIVAVFDTGVDMTIPGLLGLPDGGMKVIDVRDFTGQGEVELARAEFGDDGRLKVAEGIMLEGLSELALKPADEHRIFTGVFDEARFLNSDGVDDLDDDGSTEGRWGIVVFAAERQAVLSELGEGRGVALRRSWGGAAASEEAERASRPFEWICVIDRDADGHLDDEELLRDYSTNFDHFTFQDSSSEDAREVLGIGLDLRGDYEPELSLHYDDGGHGSHVAGIAAGYEVHGQEGLNGVAPSAWVISCKLGDNTLSGGATVTESMKKCYEYIGDLQERYDVPVVVNMSYGIGSEIEGDATMETWLDEWLDEHSRIVVCHSAGNSGPGLSNVGLPAGADGVIASAALLTREVARDLYGGAFAKDELYGFSSRGGEMAKPDVAAPGGASSTVPLWGHYDRYNGTSMASPHTAGAVALMLSGMRAEQKSWNFGTVKRALVATARPLDGYTRIDAGGGVVDVARAFESLNDYADAGEAEQVTLYTVRTEAPGQPDGEAPAAYWRSGGWFPKAPEQQEFRVTPRFDQSASGDERNKFYRAYRLKSDADWIRVDRNETYINGPTERSILLSYDADKLTRPGLYVGRVVAEAKGAGRSGAAAFEFELVVTIVVPHRFDLASETELEFEDQTLDPGGFQRAFFRVPAGATALSVRYRIPDGEQGDVRLVLHDPEGRRFARIGFADHDERPERTTTVSGEDLVPGVWEVDFRAAFDMAVRSRFDYEVSVSGLEARPEMVTSLEFAAPGREPGFAVEVRPVFDRPFRGQARGELDSWLRRREVEVDAAEWEHSFDVDGTVEAVEFTIRTDPELYSRFTDCAINIVDSDGVFVVQSGLGQRSETVRLDHPAPGEYRLRVVGGFTHAEQADEWQFELEERFVLAQKVQLTGTVHESPEFRLVPDVASEVRFTASGSPPVAPEGFVNAGQVRFVSDREGRVELFVPVRLSD
jgi:tripeptidyl-peptidase-2